MDSMQAARRTRRLGFLLWAAAAISLSGCAGARAPAMNPFAVGGVNPDSTVQAEVVAAMHAPGAAPHFSQVPVIPTDVRPVPAWRAAVVSEWATKRRTEKEAAAIPFTLANTEEWAQRTRAKIPASQLTPPSAQDAAQIEAFATAERARATPPPPPQ
jgi:hypothetical protein